MPKSQPKEPMLTVTEEVRVGLSKEAVEEAVAYWFFHKVVIAGDAPPPEDEKKVFVHVTGDDEGTVVSATVTYRPVPRQGVAS